MNVYMIRTPLQLLNIIEIRHHFGFKGNILIVLVTGLFRQDYINNLINEKEWDSVHYIKFKHINKGYDFGLRRPQNIYERCLEIYSTFDQFKKRRRLDKLARSIGFAENIILGNYREGAHDSMRHFANKLNHNHLYLVDDGTDIILINDDRKKGYSNIKKDIESKSWLKRFKTRIHNKYIDWNNKGENKLTFFTCYGLMVKTGDSLIKNEYRYLRSLSSNSPPADEVIFLGQCLIDDGYITKEDYFSYIRSIKDYFTIEKFVYIPHPRESSRYIELVKRELMIEIRKLDVPIEYEMTIRGNRPRYLASFFCSALENCSIILNGNTDIKAFYIYPEHLLAAKDNVEKFYQYFKTRLNSKIEIIRLKNE